MLASNTVSKYMELIYSCMEMLLLVSLYNANEAHIVSYMWDISLVMLTILTINISSAYDIVESSTCKSVIVTHIIVSPIISVFSQYLLFPYF